MVKIKTLENLRKLSQELKTKAPTGNKTEHPDRFVRIKVAMATCCIASGSRETMNYLTEELDKRNIEAVITQTGCMGFC